MLRAAMSSEADRKSALTDPLLILIALLLLLGAAAAVVFALKGNGKEYAHEPGARPRPIITNQIVVVNVQEVVVEGTGGGHGGGHTAPTAKAEAAPAATTPAPEAKPAEKPAAGPVTVNPPQVSATTDGRVRGRVVLKGTPPPESTIAAVKADANCGKVSTHPAKTRSYVVGADGGLRYALVRIIKAPSGAGKMPESPLIDQAGCMYEPYVSAVMVGETFKVKNSDPFMHNVNATPKINKGFNFAQASQGQVNEKSFDKPELAVKFACQVHPWMVAYLHVVENPFFAVTDDKGGFELPEGLPPGKYELEVNHLKAGVVKQEVEVGAGKGAEVVFEMVPAAK